MRAENKILKDYSEPKYVVKVGKLHGIILIDYAENKKYEKNIDLTLFKDEEFFVTFYAKMSFNNNYTAVESKFGYFDESNSKVRKQVRNTPLYETADKLNSFMPIRIELFIDLVKDTLIDKYMIGDEFGYYQVSEKEIKKYYEQNKSEEKLIGYNSYNKYFYVCDSIFKCISKKDKRLIIDDYNFHEFPEIIFNCGWVEELELYELLISEIPESLTKLKNLKVLTLRLKFLTRLPASINRLKDLEILKVENTSLDEIPDNLFELNNLKELHITNNNNLEKLSDQIMKLKKLEWLFLYRNKLNDLPKTIFGLENLEVLDCSYNKIAEVPAEISALKKLKKLKLKGNKIKRIPKDLFEMNSLDEVDLSKNNYLEKDEVFDLLIRSGRSDEINLIL